MRAAYIAGVANAQRVAREAILTVAGSVRPGDSELAVCARIERELALANVHHWLHTPYAWWGERTRFDWQGTWETNALPTERVLAAGEPFILDVAPIVAGFPADFAFSGLAGTQPPEQVDLHDALLAELSRLKEALVTWATPRVRSEDVCDEVERSIRAAELDVIHTKYPANVLAHTLEGFPNFASSAPRVGTGLQLPLIAASAKGIALHHLFGTPYPFLRPRAPGRPLGLYAVEPHLGKQSLGAKFESVLLVDGDETRWLDPGLFGEVIG